MPSQRPSSPPPRPTRPADVHNPCTTAATPAAFQTQTPISPIPVSSERSTAPANFCSGGAVRFRFQPFSPLPSPPHDCHRSLCSNLHWSSQPPSSWGGNGFFEAIRGGGHGYFEASRGLSHSPHRGEALLRHDALLWQDAQVSALLDARLRHFSRSPSPPRVDMAHRTLLHVPSAPSLSSSHRGLSQVRQSSPPPRSGRSRFFNEQSPRSSAVSPGGFPCRESASSSSPPARACHAEFGRPAMLSANWVMGSSATSPKEICRPYTPSASDVTGSLQDVYKKPAFASGIEPSAAMVTSQRVNTDNGANTLPTVLRSPISRDQVVHKDAADSLPTVLRSPMPRGQLRSSGNSEDATDSLSEFNNAETALPAPAVVLHSADVGHASSGEELPRSRSPPERSSRASSNKSMLSLTSERHDEVSRIAERREDMRRIVERSDEIGHCVPDPLPPRERSSTSDRLESRGQGVRVEKAQATASVAHERVSEIWADSGVSTSAAGALSGRDHQQSLEPSRDASMEALRRNKTCGEATVELSTQSAAKPSTEENASVPGLGDLRQEFSSQPPSTGTVDTDSVAGTPHFLSEKKACTSHPRFSLEEDIIVDDEEDEDEDERKVEFKGAANRRGTGINFDAAAQRRKDSGLQDAMLDSDFESDAAEVPGDVIVEEMVQDDCSSESDCEIDEEPKPHSNQRRFGVSCEAHGAWNQRRAAFVPTSFSKTLEYRKGLRDSLHNCPFFSTLDMDAVDAIAEAMSIEECNSGDCIVRQGEFGRSGYVVLEGHVEVCNDDGIVPNAATGEDSTGSAPNRGTFIRRLDVGRFFGEITMLWGVPRTRSVYANGRCVLGKLKRDVYQNLVTRREMRARAEREECLRRVKPFETLNDEQITHLADALEKRHYEEGAEIITQGERGDEFFVVLGGECVVLVATGTDSNTQDVQEYRRYHGGDLFGELALLKNALRSATVRACTQVEVMCLRRSKFERLLGPLNQLQQANYLADPRKCIADFYRPGNRHGPSGVVEDSHSIPEAESRWFAVYRPTSRDAIAKMLSASAVGKGLNVKGKSAKKGRLSGYVPFLQINKNSHKKEIECSPPDARVTIFYTTEAARQSVMMKMLPLCQPEAELNVEEWNRMILPIDEFPGVFGLEVPEIVMREAYIERPDISFLIGWETGRKSEPAFMDMNLHAVRTVSDPRVVLYQYDMDNAMNPHGLLIAYAEDYVKPVVSDFDTFTVGSTNVQYVKVNDALQSLNHWALDRTHDILRTPSNSSWSTRWLSVLREAHDDGFEPTVPKYGFGDATSYRLTEAVVMATRESGAVRHGAECFNMYFPQELDDHFLIVWEGFDDKPWDYMVEPRLREFLSVRIAEGFCFPVNAVWLVRDPGWYQIFTELNNSEQARGPVKSWFPPDSGLMEKIEDIHREFPEGFKTCDNVDTEHAPTPTSRNGRLSAIQDLDACERADMISLKAARLSDVTSSKPHRNSTATGSICDMLGTFGGRGMLSDWGMTKSETANRVKRSSLPII